MNTQKKKKKAKKLKENKASKVKRKKKEVGFLGVSGMGKAGVRGPQLCDCPVYLEILYVPSEMLNWLVSAIRTLQAQKRHITPALWVSSCVSAV